LVCEEEKDDGKLTEEKRIRRIFFPLFFSFFFCWFVKRG
jgi:hypothetical protein